MRTDRPPTRRRPCALAMALLIVALVGGAGLASCHVWLGTEDLEGQQPVATLNASGHVGLGAYVDGSPHDGLAAVRHLERLIGHKLQYVLWFQSWGDDERDFPHRWIEQAAKANLVPVITWEPWKRNFAQPTAPQEEYSLAAIAAGEHDSYIRSWARGARATRRPLILRFAHEQSTKPGTKEWYPWQGDPEAYRAAFRRIVDLFRAERADNVLFLWSAMWLNEEWTLLYYPGDDVVDMVGTTVLNHGTVPTFDWSAWQTFGQLFAEQYQAAERYGKPIMLTELATAEQGGSKAAWLRDCFSSLKTHYPLVQGVLLLEMKRDREWNAINWSVASSPESLEAFRDVIADSYFK